MTNARKAAILDQFLEPVSRCLDLPSARSLVHFQVDPATQARVDELAERCNRGHLTPEERSEYEAYIQGSTIIGILQSKARRILAEAA